jgi:hypothetical protein
MRDARAELEPVFGCIDRRGARPMFRLQLHRHPCDFVAVLIGHADYEAPVVIAVCHAVAIQRWDHGMAVSVDGTRFFVPRIGHV